MAGILSPKDLQKMASDAERETFEEERQAKKRKQDEQAELREAFSAREVHPEAIERINRAISVAAKQGKNQVQVLTFPASFCNDAGRGSTASIRSGRPRSRALPRRAMNSSKRSCGRSASRSVRRSSAIPAACLATSLFLSSGERGRRESTRRPQALRLVQDSRSVTCTTPGSRVVVMGSPLFLNTFSIGVFSGRTSAISSFSPASRASAMRWRISAAPIPWPWY